jgi:peptidoglycan lytic transglycosylase
MFGVFALLLLSQQPIQPVVEGMASYYTIASSSPVTATGERLDDNSLTCAMLEGEFGTYYLVVAENGKSVVVRLNDRGPYIDGRVIDLSERAMRALHPRAGTVKVKVYPLGSGVPEGRIPAGLPSP